MAHTETSAPQPPPGDPEVPLTGECLDAAADPERVWLRAAGLRRSFGAREAVRGVTFGLRRGEVVALCGPNGAGKSTTLKLLAGVLRPSGGHAFVAGEEVGRAGLAARRAMGYLPERVPAYPDMTPPAFIRHIGALRGLRGAALEAAAGRASERCGLCAAARQPIAELSFGFRRRLALAQAIVHEPPVLILDEPLLGLDPAQTSAIRGLLGELGRERAVLMSTHSIAGIEGTCGRILILCEGALVADDTPGNLVEGAAAAQVEVVLRARGGRQVRAEQLTRLFSHLPGVLSIDCFEGGEDGQVAFSLHTAAAHDVRAALFETAVANHLTVVNLHRRAQSLASSYQALVAAVHDGPAEPQVGGAHG